MKKNDIVQESLFKPNGVIEKPNGSPLPMQYLGSKARISSWITHAIDANLPQMDVFIDLFAGTGSVALRALDKYRLFLNDVQPYSSTILRSLFIESRNGIVSLIRDLQELSKETILTNSSRKYGNELLQLEKELFVNSIKADFKWQDYKEFCENTPLFDGSTNAMPESKQHTAWNLFLKYL